MPVGAVIGGVAGSLGAAAIQSNAADRAARAQQRAAEQARRDMLPFSIPGQGAMATLAGLYGINPETGERTGQPFDPEAMQAFYQSPDYQFALQGGIQGVQNSAAGQGLLRSGNTLRDLTSFGQGLATQTFGNTVNSLSRLAQIGAGAAGGAGNASMQAGAAQASGIVGSANAWGGALGNMGNYFMLNSLLNNNRAPTTSYGMASPGYTFGNPSGYTPPTAPIGTGIWPT